ncbi:MAG: hypothetical protein FWD27_00570 [Coriobacteriia bacterium]|nr:hypothetical protein [Coriobacteriia bacterium]
MSDVCHWTEEEDSSYWETDCDQAFTLIDGKPSDNLMVYCCYCGNELEEVPYSDIDESEVDNETD